MHRIEISPSETAASVEPSLPMIGIWRTLRDYILWSYERGTIQYDVMVTLILLFIFLSPYWINFKDKPVQRGAHRTEVVVNTDDTGGLVFEIDGSILQGKSDEQVKAGLLQAIEPISGRVAITRYERIGDGRAASYRVWARRE